MTIPDPVTDFLSGAKLLGVEPSVFHPTYGPGLKYRDAAIVLGLKSVHTLPVWRTNNRHPRLEFFTIGRKAFVSVRSIVRHIKGDQEDHV